MDSFSLKTKPNQHLAGRYDTNQKKKLEKGTPFPEKKTIQ